MNAGNLLFGNLPSFPVLGMLGLLGFIGFWWYVCQIRPGMRRLFLYLWLPSAVMAGGLYSLDGRGYAVTESLRLLVRRDPVILELVRWVPGNGFHATYAAIVGGAVAALLTMALQLCGLLFGSLLALVAPRLNTPLGTTGRRSSGPLTPQGRT